MNRRSFLNSAWIFILGGLTLVKPPWTSAIETEPVHSVEDAFVRLANQLLSEASRSQIEEIRQLVGTFSDDFVPLSHYREQIKADFLNQRTTTIGGFRFSHTEAAYFIHVSESSRITV